MQPEVDCILGIIVRLIHCVGIDFSIDNVFYFDASGNMNLKIKRPFDLIQC
jgi:hypothetical protein